MFLFLILLLFYNDFHENSVFDLQFCNKLTGSLSSMDIGFLCDEEKSDSSSNLVNSLDGNIGGSLQTQDSCEQNTSDGDGIGDVGEGLEELKLDEAKSSPKILHKCPCFPSPVKISNSATSDEQDEDEELKIALQQMFSEESTHVPNSHSLSLPVSCLFQI